MIDRTWYIDRMADDYFAALSDSLELEHLIKGAININDERYEKIIQIDFSGIAGTTLLSGQSPAQKEVQRKFENVLQNSKLLRDQKIKLKIRFLLMYLYSDFSYAQIEAELTPYRSTIEQKKFDPSETIYKLNSKDFFSSQTYSQQRNALDKIQYFYNRYCRNSEHFDLLNIRFTCVPLNFCILNINGTIFLDPYSYAQESLRFPLIHNTPVIAVSKDQDPKTVDIFEDHFRYMWDHPTTLFYEDATKADIDKDEDNKLFGLSEIKEPQDVSFDRKAKRIKEKFKITKEDKLNRWKFRVERMFYYMTRIIENVPDVEALFIGFSFANGKVIADTIDGWLTTDFENCLKINIVNLNVAQHALYTELMEKLKNSTMGLIFFNKDIQEVNENANQYHSKPNIYFEFGFLLSHVEKFGNPFERVMIFADPGLAIPSDYKDFGRFELTGKLQFDYFAILERMFKINKSLTRTVAINAVTNYCNRLQEEFNAQIIRESDLPKGKTFGDYKNELKSKLISVIDKKFPQK